MSFKSMPISPLLRKNLARMGYSEPTPIQRAFLEPVLAGHDAIGLAKTGTGKTTAFLLPIGERLIAAGPIRAPMREPARGPARAPARGPGRGPNREPVGAGDGARRLRALILCPTRELAIQVTAEASRLLRGTGLRGVCVHGKVAITPQIEALARGVDLLIGTPGRLRELLEANALDLSFVRTVTLDEADRMLDMGFEPQVRQLLDRIPGDRQTLLLTATMPAAVERLAQDLLRRAVKVEVDPTTTPVTHVRQRVIGIADDLKVPLLLALLAGADDGAPRDGVLVFCRTRRRAGWIATALKRHGIAVGSLHGDRSHAQRTRALSRFTRGEHRVLVATDVASRGLHVEAVRCVITYDLPLEPEEHVHRIGRAAHGLEGRGGHGEAIVLLSPDDQAQWIQIMPLVGAQVRPERAPRLDDFLGNAPERTKRAAAGVRGSGPTRSRAPRRDDRGDAAPDARRESAGQSPARARGGRDDSRGTEAEREAGRPVDRKTKRKGDAKSHVEPKRGLKKRGRKREDRPRTPPRIGTGVRRPS